MTKILPHDLETEKKLPLPLAGANCKISNMLILFSLKTEVTKEIKCIDTKYNYYDEMPVFRVKVSFLLIIDRMDASVKIFRSFSKSILC